MMAREGASASDAVLLPCRSILPRPTASIFGLLKSFDGPQDRHAPVLCRPENRKGKSEVLSATQIGMPGGLPMPLEWLLRGSSRSGGDALTLTPRPDPVRQ